MTLHSSTEAFWDTLSNFKKEFEDAFSSLSPRSFSKTKTEEWKRLLNAYINEEVEDLTAGQWDDLRLSFLQFQEDVSGKTDLSSQTPEDFADAAIAAVRFLKRAKTRIKEVVGKLCEDDVETGGTLDVSKTIDDAAVPLVEGGRPFERVEIDWVDPISDWDFNKKLYNFASANQQLPDAERIPWLRPSSPEPKLLPSDLLKRLSTPITCGELDDHEDWEYSVTHPVAEEEEYARFEPYFNILRKGLKDILIEEIQNDASEVDAMASIDPDVVAVAKSRLENGEIDVDFENKFILPLEANHSKLVAARDERFGDLVTYKEVVKPPFERIVDKNLRKDPKAWADPERPAGPQIRTFGWEPLAEVGEDPSVEETDVREKKENPDAFGAGSAVTNTDIARMEKAVEALKEEMDLTIRAQAYNSRLAGPTQIKDHLSQVGQYFCLIPDTFHTPEDLLQSLDLPEMRGKDSNKPYPFANEVIALDRNWVGLDGSGAPHKPLVEEEYWKQLESFKKPSSNGMDWNAILVSYGQELDGSDDPADKELKEYLAEKTKTLDQEKKEHQPPTPTAKQSAKDHPAKKRQLDKEFEQQWVERIGSNDGIQGIDPRTFRFPEHCVSSEEYEQKFLTHPFTSSYVFHPNFVRFRRMTQNHPLYSEYTFKKLDPPEAFDAVRNLKEFKTVVEDLERNGPQTVVTGAQMQKRNLGVEPSELKRWTSKFNECMSENLAKLESFAEAARKKCKRPDEPCKEPPEGLLFEDVRRVHPLKHCTTEFRLCPFTLEQFSDLPGVGQVTQAPAKAAEDIGSEESDSDEEEEDPTVINDAFSWAPVTDFQGYDKIDPLQMLSEAASLVETSIPQEYHLPPKVKKWIEGDYQPSTSRLKKWRKEYRLLFPNVDSSLRVPFLFMSEAQRLSRLNRRGMDTLADVEDPWALTAEETAAAEKLGSTPADNIAEETTEADSERIDELERKSGIGGKLGPKWGVWAEKLDPTEQPDMTTISEPAMEFPNFELDIFQKQAILALENGYNVFVSAHTSAGKTVVAEYAIAMSRKRRSRAIYTSPIKALSNQKYSDFKGIFDSVGLITGDVQLNETADCLVMTTEILRSMLYNCSSGIRDLEFVVLDEVHYMNNKERGHVWEEVLILLPDNVQIVMLSATVSDTMKFAQWVGQNKKKKVMVCNTPKRPVPLNQYFYISVKSLPGMDPSEGKFLLKKGDLPIDVNKWEDVRALAIRVSDEAKSRFRKTRQRWQEKRESGRDWKQGKFSATELVDLESEKEPTSRPNFDRQEVLNYHKKEEKKEWIHFINYLKDENGLPTIIFAFSRKKCDELADLLDAPELSDLTTVSDKEDIQAFIDLQLRKLEDADRTLPQIKQLSKHLLKGIGVHHSGILPLLKEMVEILFQKGKIKLLIATETFAMGVNMPARTVVFYSINKFDGEEQRILKPAEYIQMAGRAGRRGKDLVGDVVIKCYPKDLPRIIQGDLNIGDLKGMMIGEPSKLSSQFRLAYRMLLNTLTKGSKMSAVNMMKHSYFENDDQMELAKLKERLDRLTCQYNELNADYCSSNPPDFVERWTKLYEAAAKYLDLWTRYREVVNESSKFLKELYPGKFVKFRCGPITNKVGLIALAAEQYTIIGLNDSRSHIELESIPGVTTPKANQVQEDQRWFNFLSVMNPPEAKIGQTGEFKSEWMIFSVAASDILEVYKESFNLPADSYSALVRNARTISLGWKKSDPDLEEIYYKLNAPNSLKPMDEAVFARDAQMVYADMNDAKIALNETLKVIKEEVNQWPVFVNTFADVFKLKELERETESIKKNQEKTMGLYDEYCGKMEILNEFKYIVDDRVQMKGYMAARITKYEIILTEMLTRNVLKDLSPEEVAALLSFIVYQVKGEEDDDESTEGPTKNLTTAIANTIGIIKELEREEEARALSTEETDNLTKCFGLVEVMYRWAKGESFGKVIQYAGAFQEGMLVRWIQQLAEALKDIESAARVMGDNDLPKKIQEAMKKIKRGIPFSPSLYTT